MYQLFAKALLAFILGNRQLELKRIRNYLKNIYAINSSSFKN